MKNARSLVVDQPLHTHVGTYMTIDHGDVLLTPGIATHAAGGLEMPASAESSRVSVCRDVMKVPAIFPPPFEIIPRYPVRETTGPVAGALMKHDHTGWLCDIVNL